MELKTRTKIMTRVKVEYHARDKKYHVMITKDKYIFSQVFQSEDICACFPILDIYKEKGYLDISVEYYGNPHEEERHRLIDQNLKFVDTKFVLLLVFSINVFCLFVNIFLGSSKLYMLIGFIFIVCLFMMFVLLFQQHIWEKQLKKFKGDYPDVIDDEDEKEYKMKCPNCGRFAKHYDYTLDSSETCECLHCGWKVIM